MSWMREGVRDGTLANKTQRRRLGPSSKEGVMVQRLVAAWRRWRENSRQKDIDRYLYNREAAGIKKVGEDYISPSSQSGSASGGV
jgi:hypothetical protein